MLYRTRKDFTATHTDCCTGSSGFLTCSMCCHHTMSNSLHMSTSIMVQISQAISVACSCWLSWCGNRLSRRQSHQLGQNHRNAPLHIRLRHSISASPSGAASDCHRCDYHFFAHQVLTATCRGSLLQSGLGKLATLPMHTWFFLPMPAVHIWHSTQVIPPQEMLRLFVVTSVFSPAPTNCIDK